MKTVTNVTDVIESKNNISRKLWDVFSERYDASHMRPQTSGWWVRLGIWIGTISAVALSGLITVPTFRIIFSVTGSSRLEQFSGGVLGFITVDIVLFFMTWFAVTLTYRPKARKGELDATLILKWAWSAAAFDFLVTVLSNLFFVLQGYHLFSMSDGAGHLFSFVVAVALGFAAPIQALACSTILALMPLQHIVELEEYEELKAKAFARFEKKQGANLDLSDLMEKTFQIEEKPLSILSNRTDNGRTNGRTGRHGYDYMSNASDKVRAYLLNNPDDMDMRVRELADIIGVGKSTVASVRRDMLESGEI